MLGIISGLVNLVVTENHRIAREIIGLEKVV